MLTGQRLEELQILLQRGVTEGLDLELKEWIDPNTSHGKAKIAKACLALRNNDGGLLVIGFNDEGKQCRHNVPKNIRTLYSADVVQEIIGKYASEPFQSDVAFVEIEGTDHPVIRIAGGIKTPVICKSDLFENEQKYLKDNAIYVRSVTSNNRVSSSEIRRGDWDRLLTCCFENREADVARFIRRHLVDIIDPRLLKPIEDSQRRPVSKLMESGYTRYQTLCQERQTQLPDILGYREFAAHVEGKCQHSIPNVSLLRELSSNMPRVSGWNPWVILLGSRNTSDHPAVNEGGFEAFIDYLNGGIFSPHLDYWFLKLSGDYYHLRALEDDLVFSRQGYESIQPGTCLDFLLQIVRVAEGLYVALSISKTLGFDVESSRMHFAVHWRGIRGRNLVSWAESRRSFHSLGSAVQESFQTDVIVPLNVAKGEIHEFVRPMIDALFSQFGGTEIDARVVRQIVNESLERK